MKTRLLPLLAMGLGLTLLTALASTPDAAATANRNSPGPEIPQTWSRITGLAN